MAYEEDLFFFSVLARTLPFCHKLPLAACGLAPSHESWHVESCRGRLWFESSHFYTVFLLLSSFPLPGVTDRLTQARPRVYPRRSLSRAPPPVGCLSPGEISRLLPTVPPPRRLRALPGQLTFKRIKYSEWARTTRTVTRPVGQSPHVGSEGTSPCLNAFSKLCICCCLLVRSGYNYAGGQPEQEQKYTKERETNPFRGS